MCPKIAVPLLLLLVAGAIVRWQFSPANSWLEPHAPRRAIAAGRIDDGLAVPDERIAAASGAQGAPVLARLAYAHSWEGELPPAMAAFRAWTERHRAAPLAERRTLDAEGVVLARARRPVMVELIRTDPQRALALTVPAAVRRSLPTAVLEELETRVAGRGNYALIAATPPAGSVQVFPLRRIVSIAGLQFETYVYGRRRGQLSMEGASLHGIALDGHLALHESPLRVPEEGAPAAPEGGGTCPVSLLPAAPLARAAEAFGRLWEFCETSEGMLETFEQQLIEDESGSDPRVWWPGTRPPVAADPATSFTIGPQRVLVIRVDFPDLTGESVTAAEAGSTMNNLVRPFFEDASYGRTTLVTTVTSKTYRLPITASNYAATGNLAPVNESAIAAAGVDFDVASFHRIIVAHKNLAGLPGSRITFGGTANVRGRNIWINGSFSWGLLAHELGHTYGLHHSNLWQVDDGNPISSAGRSVEYGDPFDLMGQSSAGAGAHFNVWQKNRLGWVPDSAVLTIKASGTYRVYRFDHKDALGFNQPLALRVFRDGVRWYWIGLRQNFPGNALLSNGANVLWGYDRQQLVFDPQLINAGAPGGSALNSALALGRTLTDSNYGISIKPVARGGSGEAQYLDVEITVPPQPPQVIAMWGNLHPKVPMGLVGVRQFSALGLIVLRNDGSVFSWGPAAPPGLVNVESVASADGFCGAVKADGTVQLWGYSQSPAPPAPPAGLVGVRQLALGGRDHDGSRVAIALKRDGTLVAWGSNRYAMTAIPPGLNDVVAIAVGENFCMALRSDGTVVRWGVGAAATPAGGVPFPAQLANVMAIAANPIGSHALALRRDGTVVGWGGGAQGEARVPPDLVDVVAIAAGATHSLALKANGSIVGWGASEHGMLDVPASLPRVHAIEAGVTASYALVGGNALIARQPESKTVTVGSGVSLNATVSTLGSASYQWRKQGVAIAGATNPTLTFASPTVADASFYDVRITDSAGTVTSLPARLQIVPALAIAVQPAPRSMVLGSTFSLTVEATGGIGLLTYQWRRNGAAIPGATSAMYAAEAGTLESAGSYDVVIRDRDGSVTSAAAVVTVVPATRISNFSILTGLTADEPSFTVGAVVGGAGTSGQKPVLFRAVGPSLSAFGLARVLPDPKLELFLGQSAFGSNDDWGGTAALTAIFSQVGAFALDPGTTRDAAVFNSGVLPGNYTARVSGGVGASGAVIAEIYDATVASGFAISTPRLINVSVLKKISSGEVLTAGFVIVGSSGKMVLLRAVGPRLGAAPFNIDGAMPDPKLELFGGQVSIVTNDNWGGGAELAGAFRSVGAFSLDPASRDAALVAMLSPGNYTAQVSAVGGGSGLALVEVYEVP